MLKAKIRIPGLGFGAAALAFVCVLVAFILYFPTYSAGGYAQSRWTIMCCVLSMWLLLLLIANGLFFGEKPAWASVIYAAAAFLITYGALRFIQPCLTQIGIYFTVNMGDIEMNRAVTYYSITAEVFYVLGAVFTIVSAFLPMTYGGRRGGASGEVKA